MLTINKNWVLTAGLLVIVVAIVHRLTPPSVDKNIKLTIVKNKSSIGNIYQARDAASTKEVWVDNLDLIRKSRFMHPKLGNIADASDDFFVDVEHIITVKKKGVYQFYIGSDDGFSFNVNGKKICDHLTDRPFSVQPCAVNLSEGKHQIRLGYFQGYGNSGFSVQYSLGQTKKYWFGENSPNVTF